MDIHSLHPDKRDIYSFHQDKTDIHSLHQNDRDIHSFYRYSVSTYRGDIYPFYEYSRRSYTDNQDLTPPLNNSTEYNKGIDYIIAKDSTDNIKLIIAT